MKKIKICKFCGHPINEKPESRMERKKRIDKGIKEMIKRGTFKIKPGDK